MRPLPNDHLETFGFATDYDAELDPEFPGSGTWPHPVHAFGRDGQHVDEFVARWGTPRVLVVHPSSSPSWVGMFPHGGLGGASGVFATPRPSDLCIVVGGEVFVVDVNSPQSGAAVVSWQAQQLTGSTNPALLLITTQVEVIALGSDGLAWKSPRLAADDLRIIDVQDGVITVRSPAGYDNDSNRVVDVDATTGLPLPEKR